MKNDRMGFRGRAAIVGVADDASPTGELAGSERDLEIRMIREALDDAGLKLSDVDAILCTGTMMASMDLAEHLGVTPRYTDTTMTGGSSFEVLTEHAAIAISAGLCEVAVIVYAARPKDKKTQRKFGAMMSAMLDPQDPFPMVEWEMPYGLLSPSGAYALAASRHMAVYGTKPEHLAQIAVSTRNWASMNSKARHQDTITVNDVLSSPLIAEPLHRLDCCLVTDGAGAIVVASADRAKSLKKAPVYILGAASAHDHGMMISQMPDITTTAGAISGPRAFALAGIKPSDVDVFQGYDSFTITLLLHLEDLGFCRKGEGGPFVADGKLGPGGSLPTNTNGGGLSYTHPGMYGIFLLVEAARQLRGECGQRQVKDARIAVAHGCGGILSSAGTIVLGAGDTL